MLLLYCRGESLPLLPKAYHIPLTSVYKLSLAQNIVFHCKLMCYEFVRVFNRTLILKNNYVNINKNLGCLRTRMFLVFLVLHVAGLIHNYLEEDKSQQKCLILKSLEIYLS